MKRGPAPVVLELLAGFRPGHRRLGELLVASGALTPEARDGALELQRREGGRLGDLLVRSGACNRATVDAALEEQRVASSPLWAELPSLALAPEAAFGPIGGEAFHGGLLGRYARFSANERRLLEEVGEARTYEEIVHRHWHATGEIVPPGALLSFMERMRELGFLRPRDEAPPAPVRAPMHAVQPRFSLGDPGGLLDALGPAARVVFSRAGVGTGLGAIALALALVLGDARSLVAAALDLDTFRAETVGVALAGAIWATLFLHELGHGLACRRFGGTVPELGVMLYWGMPMGYCDVSAAHLFPRRSQRVLVDLAGIYVQALVGAVAVFAWRWAPLSPSWRVALLQLAAFCLVANLLNLNPLLKLDGYFLLTDLLDQPNLRPRALAFLARLGRGRRPARWTAEHTWLLVYGLAGVAYTVAFAGAAGWLMYRALAHVFTN